MPRTKPPFRADHVGSLLRPAALKQARAQRERGEITAEELKRIEDREIEAVIRKQEDAGLRSVTDGEGLYEDQREVNGPWMRGLYRSQPDGSYAIRTVAPIAYTIPMDGTVGALMERTNISHMRPAHIHFAIIAPGYDTCVTHLFQQGDEFIETDVVYGVKAPLIVEFVKKPPGKAPTGETLATPFYEVRYDFVLQQKAEALAAAE